jgi:hypothetical protein
VPLRLGQEVQALPRPARRELTRWQLETQPNPPAAPSPERRVNAGDMTAANDAQDWAQQGIEHWAQHGVDELTEREAEDRAERGENDDEPRIADSAR